MNQKKMQVLYIEQTGHILAAFTRAVAAESLVDVKSLADTDLLVRNLKTIKGTPLGKGEILSVPMDLLKAEIVDLNKNAFVMPFNFMVGGGQANEIDSTGALVETGQTLTNNVITIKLPSPPVLEDTKVWVQIQEKDPLPGSEPIRRIVASIIKAQGSPVPGPSGTTSDGLSVPLDLRTRPDEDPAPIPSGSSSKKAYFVLVLVAGRKPGFFTLTLPS